MRAPLQIRRAGVPLKGVDLKVRPVHHRLADRVRSHILLCLLAYHVEWHMRAASRELMFTDEDQQAKRRRDPVAPAKRSDAAERKAFTHALEDGMPAHSFRTLIAKFSTIVRNTCVTPASENAATFNIITSPAPKQRPAPELIQQITV